jgi:hypothetical protein
VRPRRGRFCAPNLSHTQKPPRSPSTAYVVALRLRRGLPRRAVLERSPSLLATGRTAHILRGGRCVACMSGPAIPDARESVAGDDADQASVTVLWTKLIARRRYLPVLPMATKPIDLRQ